MPTLPFIDDYALLCSRHPSLQGGYQQWLTVVAAHGYDAADHDVWSMDFYCSLWANPNGVECANHYVHAYCVLNGIGDVQ